MVRFSWVVLRLSSSVVSFSFSWFWSVFEHAHFLLLYVKLITFIAIISATDADSTMVVSVLVVSSAVNLAFICNCSFSIDFIVGDFCM